MTISEVLAYNYMCLVFRIFLPFFHPAHSQCAHPMMMWDIFYMFFQPASAHLRVLISSILSTIMWRIIFVVYVLAM